MPGEPILLVEDDEGIRESLRDIFGDLGYEVVVAENGVEAIVWLDREDHSPCVILLDLLMPKMGGLEVLDRLKQVREGLLSRVVAISASPQLVTQVQERGVTALSKPFDLGELIDVVRATCDGAHT